MYRHNNSSITATYRHRTLPREAALMHFTEHGVIVMVRPNTLNSTRSAGFMPALTRMLFGTAIFVLACAFYRRIFNGIWYY